MNRTLPVSLAAALLIFASAASTQTSKGTISGVVTDASGAAISGAQVNAKDQTGAESRTVTTGSLGEYRIDAIDPSRYTVTVTASGFSTKRVRDLAVGPSVVTSLPITLEVGQTTTTLNVEASPVQVQSDTAELGGSIGTQEITRLPIGTLNPIELVVTLPGIATGGSAADSNGVNFSVNGLRPRANNFLISGFDNNDNGIAGQALQPQNPEAISDVSILTNSYSPEFGRGGGSVTNVIYKNGTNDFHGVAYDRYAGNSLTAISAQEHQQGFTSLPHLVDNTFGFTFGGPIIRNKLFFFGSGQWDHTNGAEQGSFLVIPTKDGVTTLNALAPNYPNAAIIVNSLAGVTAPSETSTINVGNRAGCGSPCLVSVGNYNRFATELSRAYEYVTRVDYTANEKDTFGVQFIGTHNSLTPDLFANSSALPSSDTEQGGPARNLGVFWTHIFSENKINELRFTAQQINFQFAPLSSTTANPLYQFPNISIAGPLTATFGGLSSTFPQGRGHDVYEIQDAFSWVIGNHNMKIGGDITSLSINDAIPFNNRGSVSINEGGDCTSIGLTTCTGLANFLDDYSGPAGSAGKQIGNPNVSFSQTVQAYYFQDSWKIRPNLTFNYGVRWEYFGTPFNALPYPTIDINNWATTPEATRVLQKPDRNNWGPRAGIAYTPTFAKRIFGDNKTVFRLGFGTFYDGFFTNIQDNSAATAPNTLGGSIVAPSTSRGVAGVLGLVPAVTATLNPRSGIDTISNNIVSPLSYQYNANIQRQLPGNILATLAYVGTRGERLFINQQLNPGINGVRIDPERGSIVNRSNLGNSSYNGLQASAERRFKNGLFVRGAYTFSKVLDNGSEVFTSTGGSSFPQNLFNSSLDRGPAAFDQRHVGALTILYSLPFRPSGTGFKEVANYIVRNWTVGAIAQFATGTPNTIYVAGFDNNGDLNAFNDRPDLSNPAAPINYTTACLGNPACITGVGQVLNNGSLVDFNTGASGTPSQFRYILPYNRDGNVGRNTFYNPGYQQWNMTLERIFPIPHLEHHQLELRAEAINVFNHANAGEFSGSGGVSTNINDANFLNKDVTYNGNRVLNLWLKYRF